MPATATNGAYTASGWGHGATTSMPGALPPDFTNTQSFMPPQSHQLQQGTYFPPQQQQIPTQNFHQGLQQQHGHGQLPHQQQRNVELEHHYAPPSSSQANGSMSSMGMNFDSYNMNFNLVQQQYPSPPMTGPSQAQSLPQTTPPLSQYDPRQQQHIPPHQVPVRQPTNSFQHHTAAFNTGRVTGGGPPAAAPPAYVEQTATAMADGHTPASAPSGSPNSRVLGMNSKTPSPKAHPGALAASNGTFHSGFTFASPAMPGPLPQLSPQQQLLGPSVYTPQAQSLQQPALKRGRYEADVGYDDADDEGDMSGDLEHDFDFSLQGGAQQYAQQSAGTSEQQGQEGDSKARPAGACVRCKNLKVRCEFTTGDPQTCRRCMNGGHDCSVPGKKKRKQPPKREHLINEIRSQASEIKELMEKLEIANKKLQKISSDGSSSKDDATLHSFGVRTDASPLGSPSFNGGGNSGSADSHGLHPLALPRPDVQAWIMRARESIEQISGMYNGTTYPVGDEEDEEYAEEEGAEALDDEVVIVSEGSEEGYSVVAYGEEASDREDGSQFSGEVTVEAPLSDGYRDDDDAHSNAEHPPASDVATDDESAEQGLTTRHASPATTVRSVSTRSGSAAPQRKGTTGAELKARTVSKGPGAADPLKLISSLHTGIARLRSKSPSVSTTSRAGSVEQDVSVVAEVSAPASASSVGGGGEESGGAGGEGDVGKVKVEAEGEDAYGAAGKEFFNARRGSAVDPTSFTPSRNPIPHILIQGIIAPEEAEKLFAIYFDDMNLSCSLLDPILYTAQTTYWRSPFLFTVICTVASRYYTERPGLYSELTHWAQLAAGTALISGPKTVETVAAYILLSLYPIPMRRWEEDRTWIYLGLAIRVATDINLHHPSKAKPRNAQHARELANRTRVWLNCFNLDRSTASWIGKMSTISGEDYVATHSENWYNSSEANLRNFDIHISGYNEDLRVMGDFRRKIHNSPNNPSGINKDLDISCLATETDEKMQSLEKKWVEVLRRETDASDPQARFRGSLIKFAYRYGRLVVLSFGFQDALARGTMDHAATENFFQRCYAAAIDVVKVFDEELSAHKRYLRHGPEAQCVFVTFASAFLVKLLHPKYASLLKVEQRSEIRESVQAIANLLNSPEVVVDEKHSPRLWARFLEGLLATPMAKLELSPGALKHGRALPRRSTRRTTTTSSSSTRPSQGTSSSSPGSAGSSSGRGYPNGSPNGNGHRQTSPQMEMTTSPSSVTASLSSPPVLPTVHEEGQNQASSSSSNQGRSSYFQPVQAQINELSRQQQQQQSQAQVQQRLALSSSGMPSSGTGMNVDDASFSQQPQNQPQPQQQQPYQYNSENALQMDMPEYFQPPFPFLDGDMLQSMQAMPDSEVWRAMNMPGFNWLGGLQSSDVDTQMGGTIDPGMLNMSDGMSF